MEGAGCYALGHADREIGRLSAQARIFEPFTRRMLEQAGVTYGISCAGFRERRRRCGVSLFRNGGTGRARDRYGPGAGGGRCGNPAGA
jgi:hypothetical protein